MAGATSEAGTAYPSEAHESPFPGFLFGSCYSIFSFMCIFYRLLFVCFFFWQLYWFCDSPISLVKEINGYMLLWNNEYTHVLVLFVLCLLTTVLSVLRFTESDWYLKALLIWDTNIFIYSLFSIIICVFLIMTIS